MAKLVYITAWKIKPILNQPKPWKSKSVFSEAEGKNQLIIIN